MRSLLGRKITFVWLVLMLATVLSWQFGHGFGFGDRYDFATVAIVIIAFVKLRLVFLDFMELRHAPVPLRLAFELWTLAVGGTIIVFYWSGT